MLGILGAKCESLCKLERNRNLERIKTLLTTKANNFMSQSDMSLGFVAINNTQKSLTLVVVTCNEIIFFSF